MWHYISKWDDLELNELYKFDVWFGMKIRLHDISAGPLLIKMQAQMYY